MKPIDTPIARCTKLSKHDKGSIVNSALYNRLVDCILMYILDTQLDIMYVVFMESLKDTH